MPVALHTGVITPKLFLKWSNTKFGRRIIRRCLPRETETSRNIEILAFKLRTQKRSPETFCNLSPTKLPSSTQHYPRWVCPRMIWKRWYKDRFSHYHRQDAAAVFNSLIVDANWIVFLLIIILVSNNWFSHAIKLSYDDRGEMHGLRKVPRDILKQHWRKIQRWRIEFIGCQSNWLSGRDQPQPRKKTFAKFFSVSAWCTHN